MCVYLKDKHTHTHTSLLKEIKKHVYVCQTVPRGRTHAARGCFSAAVAVKFGVITNFHD